MGGSLRQAALPVAPEAIGEQGTLVARSGSRYEHQEALDAESAEQWAVLQLEAPVACSLPCLGIGSHLDSEKENTCRRRRDCALRTAVATAHVIGARG